MSDFARLRRVLLLVYVVAAVSSQSILDAAMVLIAVSLIVFGILNRAKGSWRWIGIEWALAGYVVIVVMGFIVNGTEGVGWKDSIIKFSWIVNLYFLIAAFKSLQIDLIQAAKAVCVLTLIPSLYALVSYVHGTDLITGRENSRITGFVNSSTYHAHGNALIFVFLVGVLYFTFSRLKPAWRLFCFVSIFLLGLSILLTYTRGVWLSILISSILFLALLDWKRLFSFLALAIVTGLLCFQFWPRFNERILHGTSAQANEERISLFKVNVQMWKEYPWLGIGYGENLRRNREYWDRPEWNKPPDYITSHAHNQYLNVLTTTGILGLIFFTCFFVFFIGKNTWMLKRLDRARSPQRYAILMACLWAQIEFALACLSDVSFEYAKIRALIILIWALVIAIDQKPQLVVEDNVR